MTQVFKILFFLFVLISQQTFSQSITDIRKEKEKSEKEIAYLNKLFEETKNDKSVSIGKLNILQQKIVQSKRVLSSLNSEVKYLQDRISDNELRISELQSEKNAMLDLYAKLVYSTWKKRNKTNKLMFICSSSDFNQAYNRFKYFQQIQEYSTRQLELIEQVNDSLDLKNKDLGKLITEKNETLNTINQKNQELDLQKNQENQYINDLQKQEKEVKKKLEKEKKNRQKLANELDRLIAAQVKKSGSTSTSYKLTPEEQLTSDDFAKNKGKLPWPVAQGFISEKFGVHVHSVHKRVQEDQDGISIMTSTDADVRCVFNGVVSEVFFVAGFNYVVLIRHGSYVSSYANLASVSVKKGQKVVTKEIIGKIARDPDKGNVLNLQVWKDANKLDPALWLAK